MLKSIHSIRNDGIPVLQLDNCFKQRGTHTHTHQFSEIFIKCFEHINPYFSSQIHFSSILPYPYRFVFFLFFNSLRSIFVAQICLDMGLSTGVP